MSVDFAQIRQQNPEWTNFLVFTQEGGVLFDSGSTKADEIPGFIELFKDYDNTIKVGVTYSTVHYHVHRFYDGIIYGRADPGTKRTDGFCLYRTERNGKAPLYALVTYDLPDVSARIIPKMAKTIDSIKNQVA